MKNNDIRRYCLAKPGAYEDFPFGVIPICYKVCGKLFLQLYPMEGDHKITVSCEPMPADFYRIRYPGIVVPGYHCPGRLKPYMNTVYLNKAVDDSIIFKMIDQSYKRVADKLKQCEKTRLSEMMEESI